MLNRLHDVSRLRQVVGWRTDVRRSIEKTLKLDTSTANSQVARHFRLPGHILSLHLSGAKQSDQYVLFFRRWYL
jgi:hypothetical protein